MSRDLTKILPVRVGENLLLCTWSCIFLEAFVFSALCFSFPLAGCQGPKAGTLQMSSFSVVSPSEP